MFTVNTPIEFRSFLAMVRDCAPNNFPSKDELLNPEFQLNLNDAFYLLYEGLGMMHSTTKHDRWLRDDLKILLDKSLAAYRADDEKIAREYLSEFDKKLFIYSK